MAPCRCRFSIAKSPAGSSWKRTPEPWTNIRSTVCSPQSVHAGARAATNLIQLPYWPRAALNVQKSSARKPSRPGSRQRRRTTARSCTNPPTCSTICWFCGRRAALNPMRFMPSCEPVKHSPGLRKKPRASRSGGAVLLSGNRTDQIQQPAADLRVLDPDESGAELNPFVAGQEVHHRRRFQTTAFTGGLHAINTFVKETDRHAENPGDLVKPSGTDPVNAAFVFLDF